MGNVVCSYCGHLCDEKVAYQSGGCSKSPHDSHRFIPARDYHVCSYCGTRCSARAIYQSGSCTKSPHRNHEFM